MTICQCTTNAKGVRTYCYGCWPYPSSLSVKEPAVKIQTDQRIQNPAQGDLFGATA